MTIVRIGERESEHHSAEHIGAKVANLVRMSALGLPVPSGFVLPVGLCAAIVAGDPLAEQRLVDDLKEGIAFLETATGKRFGDRRRPLLVSVRSGAARSLPGMIDTVLNIGCTPDAVRGLVRMTGNPRFAWDCRRRFLEGYSQIVLGIDPRLFSARLAEIVAAERAGDERNHDSEALERLAGRYQALVDDHGADRPDDPIDQLVAAARAVYRSWTGERACTYRRLENLEHLQGTAVTVQAMVFGNRGLSSGPGVAFSRDPSIGAKQPVIECIVRRPGRGCGFGASDAGQRGGHRPVHAPGRHRAECDSGPAGTGIRRRAGRRVHDRGGRKVWILQTRSAKRTPRAALRIAVDFVREGLLTPQEALRRLDGLDPDALAHSHFAAAPVPIGCGIGASSGIAVGRAAFDASSAKRLAACGDAVILVRPDTSTSDVAGFAAAAGIVTAVGGRTAHAALVARQMGKPCIVGCGDLTVDMASRQARIGASAIKEGEWISVDGEGGSVHLGRLEVIVERPEAELAEVERWRAGANPREAVS